MGEGVKGPESRQWRRGKGTEGGEAMGEAEETEVTGRGAREKDENIGMSGMRWGLEAKGRGYRISGGRKQGAWLGQMRAGEWG